MTVEVLGPPGAGKSTLVATLCKQSDRIHLARTYFSLGTLSPWLRSGASLLPLLVAESFRRTHSIRERIWIIRVDASLFILRRLASRSVVVFDQGPVFTMIRLWARRRPAIPGSRFERWWQEAISLWAQALDVIILLDAPDDVLLKRIGTRSKPHHLKGRSEQEARERFAKHRQISTGLIHELEARARVRVVRIDTGRYSPSEVADNARAALGLPTQLSEASPSHLRRLGTNENDNATMNIVSIGGASRSGSTLLAALLGAVEGFVAVGELRYIWSRGYQQNELCSCGHPFRECNFWRAVMEDSYGGMERVPIERLTMLHRSLAQVWHLPHLMSPRKTSRFDSRLGDYLGHLEKLCRSILKISGARTIVDSSKLPSYCYLLSRLPDTDAQLVHLVRDSRAVAFSFMRKRRKPEVQGREEYMRRFSPLRSARDWILLNIGMELTRGSSVRYEFLRYEDLVKDVGGMLSEVLDHWNVTIDVENNGDLRFPSTHMVAGNPLRFEQDSIRVIPDTEWKNRMGRRQYYVVTALTLPLLKRYGYTLR